MALKNSRDTDRTATGFEGEDRAKFGQPRRGDDAVRADEAAALNNGDLLVELVDGRCSYDGLPEGHCGHFPGDVLVTVPGHGDAPLSAVDYDAEADSYSVREDGSASESTVSNPDRNDDEAKAENAARQKDAAAKDSGGSSK